MPYWKCTWVASLPQSSLVTSEKPEVVAAEGGDGRALDGEHVADGVGDQHVRPALQHGALQGGEVGEHGGRDFDQVLVVIDVAEALNEIVAEARSEHEVVVARATGECVVAATADQSVIATTALQHVVAAAPLQDVVAVAALEIVGAG